MNDLEMFMILSPIVIPILVYMNFDFGRMDRTEKILMGIGTLFLILFLEYVCLILLKQPRELI